ncbi:flagellar assembly protein FliW [Fictibacillus sp. 23RED33]|jgi:flagellar assembly factor FliW|uniref:flagellar assembly protein FliW n=1 Tax=Fictibacillus sp. 23RED33 TaxID=2745879 RepID=UPI0018CC98AE|nr:flagellar assembly protein FliW [Fictibacillus sp. 23RED33]MBH0173827.1 flagellar assembly protein FliW [Fictibacillus sp. 23RED33]
MKIETKFKDIVEVKKSDILGFEQGLPGFQAENKFVLIPIEGTDLSLLQSVQTSELAFIITDPFIFFKEYDFELSSIEQELLDINNEKEVFVQVILTVADPFEKTTANLKAPIIINTKNNQCKQVVLTDDRYRTKHLLIEALIGQEG